MTSVLPNRQKNVVLLKQKPQSQKALKEASKDEIRSFLNFSRENLSISNSDLEQGFNKTRFRVRKHTLISVVALVLALACFGIEVWKLKWVVENTKEIEILKRDVDTLKHRLLEEDLLDELKAFEGKLYAEEGNGDDEDTEMENVDYESNYDDDSHDYTDDYQAAGLVSRSSDLTHILESNSTPYNLENIEKEKLLVAEKEDKEEVTTTMTLKTSSLTDSENISDVKQKRSASVDDIDNYRGDRDSIYEIHSDLLPHHELNKTEKRKRRLDQDSTKLKKRNAVKIEDEPTGLMPMDKHPPKKFFGKTTSEGIHSSTRKYHDISGDDSDVQIVKKGPGIKRNRPKLLWKRVRQDNAKIRKLKENLEETLATRSLGRGLTRRHLKVPRQVFAVHYGADSSLFSNDDEHTGNGRAKHSEGIFKAWKPSDWVADLGMSKHFFLSDNGRLTVQEPGLYLAYAQIHYLDDHDENGFHMLVNGRPILQCMVYSPGTGHKSRSCFSAQVTVLQSGDHVVLKDVASARYTLFQRDKSFFGLVKLGDWRQSQKHQQHSVPP